ncbi:MAG: hypothetical protein ABJP82_11705 [Hyphomicrobiales bacterium]
MVFALFSAPLGYREWQPLEPPHAPAACLRPWREFPQRFGNRSKRSASTKALKVEIRHLQAQAAFNLINYLESSDMPAAQALYKTLKALTTAHPEDENLASIRDIALTVLE